MTADRWVSRPACARSLDAVSGSGDTFYERAGGQSFFDRLVERFYEGVEHDPVLRPLYPDDLEPGKRHLALFLAQYWGGPPAYDRLRGHPRLRARHLPFAIGPSERDAWVRHMTAALRAEADAGSLSSEDEASFVGYVTDAAAFLVNQGPLTLRPPG